MKKRSMKIRFKSFLFILFFLCLTLRADMECKGGDGGSPFNNISNEFQSTTQLLKTSGLIKDFQVRESKGEIIYQSEDNTVWKSDSQATKNIAVTPLAFSRVLDPWGEFITMKNVPWAINTRSQAWYKLGDTEERGKDLYWSGRRVFSLEAPDYSQNRILYSIHDLNGYSQKLACNVSLPKDVQLHIVSSGHIYPYLLLYTTQQLKEGIKVTKFAMRLEAKKKFLGEIPRCNIAEVSEYKKLMPGKIRGLYHFGDIEDPGNSAWLMDIDHPNKRLLWSYREQCTYFNAPNSPILVPNPGVPVVAMQKEEGGLTLIYPSKEKSVDILEKWVTRPLQSKHLWLTRDKRNLYVAAQPEIENARLLFKVSLDQVQ